MEPIESGQFAPEQMERLSALLVDGAATERDWETFRAAAGESCGPWRKLAEDFGMASRLTSAFARTAHRAERVEIDFARVAADRGRESKDAPAGTKGFALRGGPAEVDPLLRRSPFLWVRQYGGWGAAAVVAVAWGVAMMQGARTEAPGGPAGSTGGILAGNQNRLPAEGLGDRQAWLAGYEGLQSRLQPYVVDAKQTDAGWELIWVRPVLERTTVDQFYGVTQDEAGRPVLRPENAPKTMQALY